MAHGLLAFLQQWEWEPQTTKGRSVWIAFADMRDRIPQTAIGKGGYAGGIRIVVIIIGLPQIDAVLKSGVCSPSGNTAGGAQIVLAVCFGHPAVGSSVYQIGRIRLPGQTAAVAFADNVSGGIAIGEGAFILNGSE